MTDLQVGSQKYLKHNVNCTLIANKSLFLLCFVSLGTSYSFEFCRVRTPIALVL
jgi:hypothetical protein